MKNNLTLLAREGKAKASQNTGGGTSQQSTAQHDSARVFKYFNTQMARFLWNKKGEATVSKSSCSWAQGRATSAEQPTNHALITHLSPTQTVSLARIWKYVACLLIAFFVGVGNVWGQTLLETDDFETESGSGASFAVGGFKNNNCDAISRSTEARTGSYSLKTTADATGEKYVLAVSNFSLAKNEILHVIAWAKFEESDKTTSSSSNQARPNAYVGGNGNRTACDLTTSWQVCTSNKKYTSSGTKTDCAVWLQRKHGGKKAVLFDDVVIYKSTNETTDIVAPTSATSASATTSEISWTNGSDANTGRQNTLIWKRNTGNTHDLSLNNQGVYAADDADQSGNWTCLSATVAKGTDASESTYEAELASGEYAIVHRDLAYNYSTPTYVTVAAGGGGGATTYDVIVEYNGSGSYGTAAAADDELAEDATTTITATPESGYRVASWEVSGTGASLSDDGSTHSNTTTLTMGTADATVTCTFEETPSHDISAVTSTGDNTYGTVSAASSSALEGGEVVITAVPASGYRVASWAVSGTGASISPSGTSNSNTTTLTMGTADATVTVTFEELYTLTYNCNGGTGSMSNTVSRGTTTLRANAYTKDGYVFAGWATSQLNANAGTIAYADAATTYNLSADATLYAVWYTVYYSFAPTETSGSISASGIVATSTGGSMTYTPEDGGSPTLKYSSNGLEFGGASQCQVTVTLSTATAAGDIIEAKVYTSADTNRGLKIANSDGTTKANFSYTATGDHIGVYTIVANDKIAEATTFKVLRNNNAYLKSLKVAKFVAPDPSCAATVPGNISKGTASGGTGSITLTAAGEIASGDTWYWQSAEDGTDKTGTSGATKSVNAAGTYYIRSYNTAGDCWSAAKSVTVDAADLLTAISPTLSYATSNIVVGNTSSPTLEGNTGSGSVSYALNNVSPAGSLTINSETGVVTAVTAGGTATVTATIAANGGYAGNTATSGTITVVAPATGTATISYALSGSTTTGTVVGVSTISSLSSSLTLSTLTLSGTKDNYSGAIKGCTSTDALDEDDYVDVQFTVASGYAFTPSSVTVKANPFNETGALKAVVKIMDAQPLVVASNVLACEKNTDNAVVFADGAFTDKEFEGTVHIRMYFYGPADTKPFYIKSPISITGTVATKVVKYDLSFAAGTGASGSMSTLKYAASTEVTLPACTFTAPSGKEFDAWVVTKTVGGASVTVTNNQFTMPAEAVTATATWKDRPKHTDATLSDLTVGGETVTGFAAATTSYNVELPFGTTSAPTVAATATDASYVKSVVVTQASSATGDATVVVTAEDGSTIKTYTVHFSVAESKDIRMVWKKTGNPCGESSAPTAFVLSTDDAIKDYLSISFVQTTEDNSKKAEEKSDGYLSTGKSVGNLVKITAKPGFAFKNMSFYGKIETNEVKCPISIDGGETWIDVTGTVGSDAQHCDVFTDEETHEIILKNNAGSGTWLRHMDLTMIQACTPKTIAWTTAPATEYEVGKSGYAIAASANNGTVSYASDDADVIAVNSSNGALTLKALGTVTLSASVPAGDGVTYCNEAAQVSKANVKTYYLVTFDKQNETTPATVKYYKNDAAIALPEDPTYSGFNFLGWYDASTGGTEVTSAITPTASRTVYAQWEAQCAGPTITTQPASANYFVGRTASALTCEATAGDEGELTYTWYSCDDAERTNPVALAGAPTPSTAAVGTFYYYCTVQEAGCDVVRTSDVAVITITEKDMLRIIKIATTGGSNKTVSGYFAKEADCAVSLQSDSKFGTSSYMKMALDEEEFQAGDVLNVHITAVAGGGSIALYSTNNSDDALLYNSGVRGVVGDNKITLTDAIEGRSTLYLCRTSGNGWNPYVDYIEVYRPYPQPLLTGITIDEAVAVVDELDATVYNVTIPAGSNLASLDVVPTFLSNDPSQTNGEVTSNEGAWVVGSNTYVVTDKDGDSKSYTINIARDVAVESVSVSGETTVAAKSQITLTATVLPAEVSNKAVTWSSSDETKATVNANGVVTGKAAGSVTITATSVADGTKKGTKEITVTKFVGTEYAYWFASTTDATTNDITNDDGTIFENAPTDGSNLSASLTMDVNEVETTYSVTRRSGDSDFGTFHVPADYTANLHMLVIGSGSPRTLTLKETSTNTEYSSAPATFGDAAAHIVFANIPSGNYTFDKHSQSIRVALMVAELNSYPLTSIALEESFNLRLGQSRTPVFTLTPTKAAVVSQVWSEVSRTGASDATLNTSTGEITAGTEEGTLTVKVSVTDAFGNEAESGNCVVKIVNIIDQKDVTGSMTWNWTGAGTANVSIGNEEALVLGNYINGDEWAYIKGTKNDYAYNTNNSGCYQGKGTLSFKTTVPGLVTITARRISNNADLKIGEDVVLSLTDSKKTSKAYFVPAGEVNIIADATEGMRILKIEFDANITADKAEGSHFGGHIRPVTEGQMTTVCVNHNVPAGCIVGAEVYKLLYWKYGTSYEDCQMVDFEKVDEMNAGEPYMVLPTESTFALFYGKTTVDEPKAMSNGFTGTFDAIDPAYENVLTGKYAIVGTTILKLGHNCGSSANRAYIDLSQTPSKEDYEASLTPSPSSAPKKRVSLGRKSEHVATGMDGINVESEQVQKVMIDGQMYVVRGGHIYNATGILVK